MTEPTPFPAVQVVQSPTISNMVIQRVEQLEDRLDDRCGAIETRLDGRCDGLAAQMERYRSEAADNHDTLNVRISGVFEGVQAIRQTLAEAAVGRRLDSAEGHLDDHEERLRVVEKRSWLQAGRAAVLAAIATVLLSAAVGWAFRHLDPTVPKPVAAKEAP